ncbi:GNAT family N-acetyltransferase [Pseudalkalibacillus sp. Hm43]|uniref:GNAT family N-acetyltransferase n=1 Tax=Pseudalkalibacillus sp. Hm43 TaxID=3450742 RepID=UPI003F437DD3
MDFKFIPITIEYVKEIDSWNYEGFIEEVWMTPYFESFNNTEKLRGPGGCEGFVALLDNKAVGLFEFRMENSIMEIGLALRPDLVGKGLGVEFVNQGIEFGLKHYDTEFDYIRLEVHFQNKAAIRVYEKVGFVKVEQKATEIEMRKTL